MAIDAYTAGEVLARSLREAREAKNVSVAVVASACDMSKATISRLETAVQPVSRPMLTFLCHFYGLDERRRVELESLRRIAHAGDPFDVFRRHVPRPLLRYYAAQATALVVQEFAISTIPVLLRTDGYERAVSFYERGTVDAVQWGRLHRQVRDTTGDVRLCVIVGEEALERPVGGFDVMLEQLDELSRIGSSERVQIRVVPYDAGALPGYLPFTLLTHEHPWDGVSAYGRHGLDASVALPSERIPRLAAIWSRLEQIASPPEDLDRMLGQALTRLKDHQRTPL